MAVKIYKPDKIDHISKVDLQHQIILKIKVEQNNYLGIDSYDVSFHVLSICIIFREMGPKYPKNYFIGKPKEKTVK